LVSIASLFEADSTSIGSPSAHLLAPASRRSVV